MRVAVDEHEEPGHPQNLSNLAWSFAARGVYDLPMRHASYVCSPMMLENFVPQELSTLAWSYSVFGIGVRPRTSSREGQEEHATLQAHDLEDTSCAFSECAF
eukprot:gnl/MRDRNA2_/MRDRNA2_85081_c0_seq1.p3 gnl/MRDRNA2_/MRDRNA2_85081_c0~~gnl/MRDRNA2_/MRDRNA2_85081_c0_seq1.p3  ORF type:complete len:102 (+),score=13.46 gnl/MRDRNA2_/MRDRNA2_85081_c0_seq1:630-935(+)